MKSSRHDAAVEDLKDDIVVISPQYLIQNYGLSKRRAMAVAIAAREICSRRWPRAKLWIADDTLEEVPSPFIKPNYESKIRQSDFDMHAWNCSGAFLRAEIHDFLLISACEEARLQLPERPLEAKGSTDGGSRASSSDSKGL